jgi:hypothetical protein
MDINKRVFSGSCIPLGTPLGKVLINSKDQNEVAKAVRKAVRGKKSCIKLSEETIFAIKKLKEKC